MAFVAAMKVMRETQKKISTGDHIYKALTTRGSAKCSYADRMTKVYPCKDCGQALMPVENVPPYEEIAIMTNSGKKCKVVPKGGDAPATPRVRRRVVPGPKPWKTTTTKMVVPKAAVVPERKVRITTDADVEAVQAEIERVRKEAKAREERERVVKDDAPERKAEKPHPKTKAKKKRAPMTIVAFPRGEEVPQPGPTPAPPPPSVSTFALERREADLRNREREMEQTIQAEIDERWKKLHSEETARIEERANELTENLREDLTRELTEKLLKEFQAREDLLQVREEEVKVKEARVRKRRRDHDNAFRGLVGQYEKAYADANAAMSMQYTGLCQQLQLAEQELRQQLTSTVLEEQETIRYRIKDMVDTARMAEAAADDPKEQYAKVVQCLCKLAPLAARLKRADGWFGTGVVPKSAPISSLVDISHRIVAASQAGDAASPPLPESAAMAEVFVPKGFAAPTFAAPEAIPSVLPSVWGDDDDMPALE